MRKRCVEYVRHVIISIDTISIEIDESLRLRSSSPRSFSARSIFNSRLDSLPALSRGVPFHPFRLRTPSQTHDISSHKSPLTFSRPLMSRPFISRPFMSRPFPPGLFPTFISTASASVRPLALMVHSSVCPSPCHPSSFPTPPSAARQRACSRRWAFPAGRLRRQQGHCHADPRWHIKRRWE